MIDGLPGVGCAPAQAVRGSVCFVPYLAENPYQPQLAEQLRTLGFEVATHWSLAGLWRACRERQPVPDLVHLHWLPGVRPSVTGFRRALAYPLRLRALRRRGLRFVWTAHNLYHHEVAFPRIERWLTRQVISQVDRIIVHSPSARELVRREFQVEPDDKLAVIPHGNFLRCYPGTVSSPEARARLGLPPHAQVFLFFGQIRPYKGLLELVAAFRRLNVPDARLVIAGKAASPAVTWATAAAVQGDARILFRPGFVPDEEVPVYLAASDVVVFPYHDVLTSGALILAMSFARACIAPSLGCIPDTLDASGSFLYSPAEHDGLHRALTRAIHHRADLGEMGRCNLERARQWDWAGIAAATADVYTSVLHASSPGEP